MPLAPKLFILLWLPALVACHVQPPGSPILRPPHTPLHQIQPDGTLTTLNEKSLTAFQRLIRSRLPAPGQSALPAVQDLYALEVDFPAGNGDEGAYIAILHSPTSCEFLYFEQADHLPRQERCFHRPLSSAETAEFLTFIKDHPTPTLRLIPNLPTTRNATSFLPPSTPPDTPPETPEHEVVFRYTDAGLKEATTLLIPDPTPDDHPAIDLIRLFSRFRDAPPGLTCIYVQPIPTNARILFAHPRHHVLAVWSGAVAGETPASSQPAADDADHEDLRVLITPPLPWPASTTPAASNPSPPASQPAFESQDEMWYAYRAGNWIPSEPPPTTEPATRPVAPPAPGSPPNRSASSPLPSVETWSTEPANRSTNVWHYIPIDRDHGQWLGFVVPNLVFDDAHAAVNPTGQILYLIHDGQLIALPIPQSALMLR